MKPIDTDEEGIAHLAIHSLSSIMLVNVSKYEPISMLSIQPVLHCASD